MSTTRGAGRADERIEAIRRFNRFYTQRIGVLRPRLLDSAFSLTEARVLYELAHRAAPSAGELRRELDLDAGYLSRILGAFERRGLITRAPSPNDARRSHFSLTARGRRAFASLDREAREQIASLLADRSAGEQHRLLGAMQAIEAVLENRPEGDRSYLLRPHRPGDIGWVVQRHGVLYAQEYGWDETFEGFVADIAGRFLRSHDPSRERCWIAERNHENVGCVFLVAHSATVAKLRLLLVEPSARGLGIGTRLVDECIRFARHAGYRKVTLWTNSVLRAARRIYEEAGFRLLAEEPHHSFGRDLVGQTWELALRSANAPTARE
ncbi:MAG TPA: helix-turn-helix domain-containing GNAT family N-acetyltransferase [Burkholderiales bacterium]|nr:helix-turn-helix domain-containing GNAT family N-acetyltransferase [Burkholderiales bacterium]